MNLALQELFVEYTEYHRHPVNVTIHKVAVPMHQEISYTASPHIVQGYWNNPPATRETFQARLAGGGEGPFLRSGDLGFMPDGELFIAGRLKDVIMVRGQNHYPRDIEATAAACHPALRPNHAAPTSYGWTVNWKFGARAYWRDPIYRATSSFETAACAASSG